MSFKVVSHYIPKQSEDAAFDLQYLLNMYEKEGLQLVQIVSRDMGYVLLVYKTNLPVERGAAR